MTTIVNLSALEAILGGYGPVDSGFVSAQYWAGGRAYVSVVGDEVRLPSEIRVAIVDGETVPLTLEPTDGKCCARWEVRDIRTRHRLIRYTDIPDVAEIDFGDLTDVDPSTFEPSAAGQAAWDAAVAAAQAAVSGAVTARDIAVGSASAAVDAANAAVPAAASATISAGNAESAEAASIIARAAAEAAAVRAEAIPATTDAVMLGILNTPAADTTKKLAATYDAKALVKFDIRAYGGALNDATKAAQNTTALTAAREAAIAFMGGAGAFGTRRGAIYIPAGVLYYNGGVWTKRVSIVGEGMAATILRPQGVDAAGLGFYIGQPGVNAAEAPVDGTVYRDFTIDGADQTVSGSYHTGCKGFNSKYMKDAVFTRVRVMNTVASGFGIDYLQSVRFTDCYAVNCGRLNDGSYEGGAGFGIGTGTYLVEDVTLSGCVAINCGKWGLFTETQGAGVGAPYKSAGMKVVGCHFSGNKTNIGNAGSRGMLIDATTIVGGEYGIAIVNANNEGVGERTVITNVVQYGASKDGLYYRHYKPDGVIGLPRPELIVSASMFCDNSERGINIVADTGQIVEGLSIDANCSGNTLEGLVFGGAGRVKRAIVKGQYFNNGNAGIAVGLVEDSIFTDILSYDNRAVRLQNFGIRVNGSLTDCIVSDSDLKDHGSATNAINGGNFIRTRIHNVLGYNDRNTYPGAANFTTTPFTLTNGPRPARIYLAADVTLIEIRGVTDVGGAGTWVALTGTPVPAWIALAPNEQLRVTFTNPTSPYKIIYS